MILAAFSFTFDTIVSIVSAVFALAAVFLSIIIFLISNRKESYVVFDKAYANILEKGLENPSLRDPIKTCDYDSFLEKDRAFYFKYCAYAYMVWNFLETIYDLSNSKKKRKRDLFHTWSPVLIEENKLHYRWFTKNPGPFKKEFQDYVRNYLNDITIEQKTDIDSFLMINKYLREEFPIEELKDKNQMIKLLIKGQYRLFTARFTHQEECDKTIIGYAIVYSNSDNNFIFVDYIHILDEYQNCGHGTRIFNLLMKEIKGSDPQGILFEIESSKSKDENSDRIRRRKFYLKSGASELYCPYRSPYKNGKSIQLSLMFRPVDGKDFVPKEMLRAFIKEAISTIHSDYAHTSEVIAGYIDHIPNYEANSEIVIHHGNLEDLNEIIEYLKLIFPANLVIKKEKIVALMLTQQYDLILLKDQEGILLGFAFGFLPKDKNFLFLDYFMILPFYRNHGYGKMFIEKICVKSYKTIKYGIVCESMVPPDSETDEKTFIAHTNGCFLEGDYAYPLKRGKIPIKLAFYPKDGITSVDGEHFENLMKEVLLTIHDDIVNENNYDTYLKAIEDFEK